MCKNRFSVHNLRQPYAIHSVVYRSVRLSVRLSIRLS